MKNTLEKNLLNVFKKALEDSDDTTVIQLATGYEIKEVVFESEEGEKETPFTLVIPNLRGKIKEWASEILSEEFPGEIKKIKPVLHCFSEDSSLYDGYPSISKGCHYFLSFPPETIKAEFKKYSDDFSPEILEVAQNFILRLKDKIEKKIESQKKILSFFISTGQMDPTYLLHKAFLNRSFSLMRFLIEEKKADFNAHIKQIEVLDNLPQKQEWCSLVTHMVKDAHQEFQMVSELLSLLLRNNLNPDTPHAFHLNDYMITLSPWIPFTTMLAFQRGLYPWQLTLKYLYKQTVLYKQTFINPQNKLAICLGMYDAKSPLFEFRTNYLYEKKLLAIIFMMAGFNSQVDLTHLEPFINRFENNYGLLAEEIASYNAKIRSLFYIGLHLNRMQSPLKILCREDKLTPASLSKVHPKRFSYIRPLSLIFKFAEIDKSAHQLIEGEIVELQRVLRIKEGSYADPERLRF